MESNDDWSRVTLILFDIGIDSKRIDAVTRGPQTHIIHNINIDSTKTLIVWDTLDDLPQCSKIFGLPTQRSRMKLSMLLPVFCFPTKNTESCWFPTNHHSLPLYFYQTQEARLGIPQECYFPASCIGQVWSWYRIFSFDTLYCRRHLRDYCERRSIEMYCMALQKYEEYPRKRSTGLLVARINNSIRTSPRLVSMY